MLVPFYMPTNNSLKNEFKLLHTIAAYWWSLLFLTEAILTELCRILWFWLNECYQRNASSWLFLLICLSSYTIFAYKFAVFDVLIILNAYCPSEKCTAKLHILPICFLPCILMCCFFNFKVYLFIRIYKNYTMYFLTSIINL